MFDVAIWGTVANWVSGIATSCAATIALSVAIVNARNARRDQELVESEKRRSRTPCAITA